MLIERLEYLMTLAREGHFGRAAEVCGVSQPTLSFGIKQLEQSLGVMLVERGSRFRGLTPEGVQVLSWAQRIVADAAAMRAQAIAARGGLSGRLRIAAIPTALAALVDITTPLREKYPAISFTVLSRSPVEILAMLGSFEIDAGVTYLDDEQLGDLVATPLYQERYHLVTSAGCHLHDRKEVSWAEVAELPLCLLTTDACSQSVIERHLPGATPSLQSNSMIVLLSHIRTGRWSSIMPLDPTSAAATDDTLLCIPIVEPAVQNLVGIIASRSTPQAPLVDALVRDAAWGKRFGTI